MLAFWSDGKYGTGDGLGRQRQGATTNGSHLQLTSSGGDFVRIPPDEPASFRGVDGRMLTAYVRYSHHPIQKHRGGLRGKVNSFSLIGAPAPLTFTSQGVYLATISYQPHHSDGTGN